MIMPRNANKVARIRRTALTCHLRSCSLSRRRVSIDNIGAMMEEMRVDAKKDRSGLLRVRVSRGAGWSRVDQQGIKNYARAKEGYTLPPYRASDANFKLLTSRSTAKKTGDLLDNLIGVYTVFTQIRNSFAEEYNVSVVLHNGPRQYVPAVLLNQLALFHFFLSSAGRQRESRPYR
jgi:hypothetical protein